MQRKGFLSGCHWNGSNGLVVEVTDSVLMAIWLELGAKPNSMANPLNLLNSAYSGPTANELDIDVL